MKLHVLSDLHLSVEGFEAPPTQADVIVLAGDIARPAQAVEWASRLGKPVVYVAGNHEFYGSSIDATLQALASACAGTRVHFLNADELVIDGVRFLGATLWTDFLLFGGGQARQQAMANALPLVRDFSRIRRESSSEALFTPADSIQRFEREAAWLNAQLQQRFDGPTVVVTHHAPSPRSIHARFAASPINAAFVSDAQALLAGARARLWIHGHTHDSFDYTVNGTRVVCNPRGYAKLGVNENAAFDAALVIEI